MREEKFLQDNVEELELPQKLGAAIFSLLLGVFILLGVGFTDSHVIHNATHDSRHANSFPCH